MKAPSWTARLTTAAMLLALGGFMAGEAHARGPYNSARSSLFYGRASVASTNIPQQLERLGTFTILLDAVEKAGLSETLSEGGPFTLFAPTDQAFIDLLTELDITPQQLLNSPDLTNILLYHLLGEAKSAGSLLQDGTATTLYEGQPLLFTLQRVRILVNDSLIKMKNVRASNGLIQVIDAVLIPPTEDIEVQSIVDVLRLDGRFTILLDALNTAALTETVAMAPSLTLFAPTDAAFLALLEETGLTAEELLALPSLGDILKYHAVGGDAGILSLLLEGSAETLLPGESIIIGFRAGKITVNQASIVSPDINAPNGRIQVLDGVLLP